MTGLSLILHRLQHAAQKSAPLPQSRDLKSGLRITLQFSNGRTYLSVSRSNVTPSFTEFETVFRFYAGTKPTSALVREPKAQPLADGWFYLLSSWDNQRDCAELQTTQTSPAIAF